MKLIFAAFSIVISVHLCAQSKKQIIALQTDIIQSRDAQIQKCEANIEVLLKSNRGLISELNILKHDVVVAKSQLHQTNLLITDILKIIPALTIPPGFPEVYVPKNKDLYLFNQPVNVNTWPYVDIT